MVIHKGSYYRFCLKLGAKDNYLSPFLSHKIKYIGYDSQLLTSVEHSKLITSLSYFCSSRQFIFIAKAHFPIWIKIYLNAIFWKTKQSTFDTEQQECGHIFFRGN